MKLLLADDHAIVRRGLIQVLKDKLRSPTLAETATAQGAIEAIRKEQWDLVILDINLPDKNGIEALKEMKSIRPTLPVLILSLYPEEQYATRALRAGAAGYVTKDTAPEEVAAVVEKILQGGKYVSASLAECLADELAGRRAGAGALHELLSDRELEVLRLLATGKTPTEIADHLALSVKTVSTYRARLLDKLHVRTTAELIRYAVDHHLAG